MVNPRIYSPLIESWVTAVGKELRWFSDRFYPGLPQPGVGGDMVG